MSLSQQDHYQREAVPRGPATFVVDCRDTSGPVNLPRDTQRKRWHKSKWWLGTLLFLVIIILIGVLAGLLTARKRNAKASTFEGSSSTSDQQGRSTSFTSPPASPTGFKTSSKSVCAGRTCLPVLSVAKFTKSPRAFLFGLGVDSAYWYRETDGERWTTDWKSLGGDFVSPPAVVSRLDGYVEVQGLMSNASIVTRTYYDGVWNSTWKPIGKVSMSRIVTISSSPWQIETYVLKEDAGIYGIWANFADGYWTSTTNWNGLGSGPAIGTAPVIISLGRGTSRHLAMYQLQRPSIAYYKTWNIGGSWSKWVAIGGNFSGEPFLISRDESSVDFFGVGVDKAMYHAKWDPSNGYSNLTNLGGTFQTSPQAFTTGNDRIDLLAVGTDDRLKHKAFLNSQWSREWEDLGGAFNSTPVVVTVAAGKVLVYGIGQNGSLFHGSWSIGDQHSWGGDPNWLSDGGYLSTNY